MFLLLLGIFINNCAQVAGASKLSNNPYNFHIVMSIIISNKSFNYC